MRVRYHRRKGSSLNCAAQLHQATFAHAEFTANKKTTRREKFLALMEEVIPWARLLAVIEPPYPKGQRGRPPVGLELMLRVYFLQPWYGLGR